MQLKTLEQLKKEHKYSEDMTCDLGVCKNKADYVITSNDVCVENELRLCKHCASELKRQLKNIL